jgi:hypothetical protein
MSTVDRPGAATYLLRRRHTIDRLKPARRISMKRPLALAIAAGSVAVCALALLSKTPSTTDAENSARANEALIAQSGISGQMCGSAAVTEHRS